MSIRLLYRKNANISKIERRPIRNPEKQKRMRDEWNSNF